jgi:hypothetical protein
VTPEYHTIEPDWQGDTCVIVGTGPSLTIDQVETCRGEARMIVVNDAFRLAPWADHLHACDYKWWLWHHEEACQFEGVKTTLEDPSIKYPGVKLLNNTGVDGYDERPWCCRTGCNGGFQAVHIAMHYGVKRIILIGMDHRIVDNKTHFFGDHPDNIRSEYYPWLLNWQTLIEPLKERGIEVINCTPDSHLNVFPRGVLDDCI